MNYQREQMNEDKPMLYVIFCLADELYIFNTLLVFTLWPLHHYQKGVKK